MRREWAGTSGSARAGRENRHVYAVHRRRRTGVAGKRKEGGLKLSRHRNGPRDPALLKNNSWAGFSGKLRALILIIPQKTICALHARLDLRIGKLLPSHSRRKTFVTHVFQLTVLIRNCKKRTSEKSRRFHFILEYLSSVRGKNVVRFDQTS